MFVKAYDVLYFTVSETYNLFRLRNMDLPDYLESVITGQAHTKEYEQTDAGKNESYESLCFAG